MTQYTPPPPPGAPTSSQSPNDLPVWQRPWAQYGAVALAGLVLGVVATVGGGDPTASSEYRSLERTVEQRDGEIAELEATNAEFDAQIAELEGAVEDAETRASELSTMLTSLEEAAEEAGVVGADGDVEPAEEREAPSVSETFTMPSLVGMNLQLAQDSLQELGSYFLDQEDWTGDGRRQLIDTNWQVCAQEPAAGTETSIGEIVTLWSVKLSETC
ncbi:PASTA domain-containing protein [Demequina pelophila]|uniref:PASTA domain-containing protein n=1 Tax=Demequina pelophila TaxID=1638984 RepID=UPI000783139D|nr:PASTA domain-containing protein [Demequina pelophila]